MPQGSTGKIELFEDFYGAYSVAQTFLDVPIGPFRMFGQGINEADSGAAAIAGATSGAVRLTTTDEAAHSAAIGTQQALQPSTMGTIVVEARLQLENLDTKNVFFGLSDDGAATAIEPAAGATTTFTLNDSDLIGFAIDHDLTSDEEWHTVHNGGASAGVTDSTALVTGVDAVAGEWDILRIEVDTNGTARWYINEDLKKTLVGAVAPTTVFSAYAMVTSDGAAVETLDVDYLLVRAARDWTR